MINKTGLQLQYKVMYLLDDINKQIMLLLLLLLWKDDKSERVYKQSPKKNILLLSCQEIKSPKVCDNYCCYCYYCYCYNYLLLLD